MNAPPISSVSREKNALSDDDLFRGLFVALRLKGQRFIDTREDAHHARFKRVVEALQIQGSSPSFPKTFVPSPFTSRYRELDDALLRFQRGLLGAQNPFYPCVVLQLSEERAQTILQRFPPQTQKFLETLAGVFIGEELGQPIDQNRGA